MIRTESEYRDAIRRLEIDLHVIENQRAQFTALDLTPDEVAHALEPALTFHDQLREEVDVYERMRRCPVADHTGRPPMIRTIFAVGIFTLLGLFALKLVFGVLGVAFTLFGFLLGFNVTLGLGLWSFHAAYRKEEK